MKINLAFPKTVILCGLAAAAVPASLSAQQQYPYTATEAQTDLTVNGTLPADLSELPEGPEIEGFISARDGERMQVTTEDGAQTVMLVSPATEIKARGGFLGLGRTSLESDQLYNGVPVSVRTVQWGDRLIAERISMKDDDLETAAMIQRGTAQSFAEQTAATEAL
ncbi:MAG TPA: cell envelope biogenesis protein OmpA, partial [Microbacterium sp.]|nr:cell envelope biogenesis protein OmpA [Microbacterium sp.]